MQRFERWVVAVVALVATWLFFCEYIPPTKRVHLWSDIEGYHYPLLSYAHKSIQNGRVPLWDPSIYCGQPFAANIQAGLFYPPNWLLFVANADLPPHLRGPDLMRTGYSGLHGIRFTSVEILAFIHVWLAFLFTFLWLRERTSTWFSACIGGAVAAFSGYMLSQMNHLGVACGYGWMAFALWGVEQANQRRAWRPLWKVAVGSALCALAGYPSTWVALWLIVIVYALALPWRRRLVVLVPAALLVSCCLAAVQLLPTAEAAALKASDLAYGSALPFGNEFYAALLLPNYFDQNRTERGLNRRRAIISTWECPYYSVSFG